MHVLEAGDWSLLLPAEWLAEQDGDSIVIGDRDEVGCIEFSELRRESGDFSAADLENFTRGETGWGETNCGSFSGVKRAFCEEGAALREWYLFAGELLLYVTYSCDLDNRHMDDAAVDEIMETLRYVKD